MTTDAELKCDREDEPPWDPEGRSAAWAAPGVRGVVDEWRLG